MFKKLLLLVVLVVAAFLIYVATLPDEYRVERKTTIDAPPSAVFAQVNDFHNWEKWSPWIELDPKAKVTFEGSPSGKGAIFRWAGNMEVGSGSMTIVEEKMNQEIDIEMNFVEPMQNSANVKFSFKPVGDKTEVTWAMAGERDYKGKVLCTVMGAEKMIGEKYEEGLANLKNVVEKKTDATAAPKIEMPKAGSTPAAATGDQDK